MHAGGLDLAGPVGARDVAPTRVVFPPSGQGRHPDFQIFRGSMLRLHVPLQRFMASLSTDHT